MPEGRPNGRLTSFQTRRLWRCLVKMSKNYPTNPMDVEGRTRMANENREAAGFLATACTDSADELPAAEVNESITAAEDTLGLHVTVRGRSYRFIRRSGTKES